MTRLHWSLIGLFIYTTAYSAPPTHAPTGEARGRAPAEAPAKGNTPEVVDPKGNDDVEFVPDDGVALFRDTIAFFDAQEAEIKQRPDSDDKTRALDLVKRERDKVIASAKRLRQLQKNSETKLLVSAYNLCFVGAEIGLLRIKWVTVGAKARLCLTFGHQIDPRDGKGVRTTVALTSFVGGQTEVKPRGKVELSAGGSMFIVSEHGNFKKVKISDLEGVYWGLAAEVPLPTTLTIMKNGGTWMGSLHRRLGSKTSLGLTGPEDYKLIPYVKSDIYLYEPFGVAVTENSRANVQSELVYFKTLNDLRGSEPGAGK